MHQSSAAVAQLKDVVVNQVQRAMAGGNYQDNGTDKCIRAFGVPDATLLCKPSVSNVDVFVHV